MKTTQLRRLARINPGCPNFEAAGATEELTFMPLETVWSGGRADTTRRAIKADVVAGYTRFDAGDILVPKVTPTFEAGRSCRPFLETLAGAASTEVHVVRAVEADPDFLTYVFQSRQFLTEGACSLEGVGNLRRVPVEWLSSYPIWEPRLDEQRRIASFLDRETAKIDALIAKQDALASLMRERRAALLFREAGARALEMSGYPADKLGRHCVIGNGSTPSRDSSEFWEGGQIPWLNSSVVNLEEVTEPTGLVTKAAMARCHLPWIGPDSLLVGLTGQGKTRGMATVTRIATTINQHLAYVRPSPKHWDCDFLLLQLRANYSILRAVSDENGSTKGGLTCYDLAGLRVAMPPLDVQRRIASTANAELRKLSELSPVLRG